MTPFKVEGQKNFIFKTPSQDHVSESQTSVRLGWGFDNFNFLLVNDPSPIIQTVNP